MVIIKSQTLGVYFKKPLEGFTRELEEAHRYSAADLEKIGYQGEEDPRGLMLMPIAEVESRV